MVHVHRGASSDVLERFPDAYFDWIYIDGNHLYEYVRSDLEIAMRKVKPSGLITGDDYGDGGWWLGGVKHAVDELVARDDMEAVMIGTQFMLRRTDRT